MQILRLNRGGRTTHSSTLMHFRQPRLLKHLSLITIVSSTTMRFTPRSLPQEFRTGFPAEKFSSAPANPVSLNHCQQIAGSRSAIVSAEKRIQRALLSV